MRTRSLNWVVGIAGVVAISIAACGGGSSSTFNDGQTSSSGSSGGTSGDILGGDGGSSSGTSGSSGSSEGGPGPGVVATCIVGSQGCLCDSRGQCAPPLTCVPQPGGGPPLCCSGSNCASTGGGGGIGTVCPPGAGGGAACTPGSVTIPPVTAGNDSCGYSTGTFNENIIFCGMTATGGGAAPATISVFYNDEHAIPLGCANATNPVSTYSGTPTALYYPQTGDPACTDTVKRPMRPVLFITDITADPSCTAGDQQHGGTPYDPVAIFGSWKAASENGTIGQPTGGDPASNAGWNLGPGADPVPASVKSVCSGSGYSAEIQFAAGLIPGHSYRLQAILHDGDQTRGADSGEGCATFCASAGVACQPSCGACTTNANCCSGLTCSNGVCGPCSDGGIVR